MPQKYFSIDGVATFLHHLGATTLPEVAPDVSHGEVVLCLHGAGGNGNVFSDLMRALSSRHSPLAFDMPGHGRSGGLDSLGSIERMAAFTRALTEKLALRPAVLFGHSMGAAVALRYALDHPAEVRGLVLCGGAARADVPDELLTLVRRVTEGKERRPFLRETYAEKTPPEVLQRGFMEDIKTDPRVLYGDLQALAEHDVAERLGEIAAPTLVLTGEEELEPLREQADLLARTIPGASRVSLPGAGHMLPLEDPAGTADAVADFLGGSTS